MGTRKVAVVTDSTSYLPGDVVDKYGVTVVPLCVVLDGVAGQEGVDVGPAAVAHALAGRRPEVSTSRPTPASFAAAYLAAAEAHGTDEIVSVHLSAALSGTCDAAHAAAREVADRVRVHVVDTRSLAMGEGFPVIAAAEAAASGAEVADVVGEAEQTAAGTRTLFYVDTLEHLRRGGRIGAASALLGTALMVKPILHVLDGTVAPLEKLRTAGRALARLEELALEEAGEDPVDLAVHHLGAPARAAELADRLRYRVPGVQSLYVSEVGAVVGAHTGPGMLGIVIRHR